MNKYDCLYESDDDEEENKQDEQLTVDDIYNNNLSIKRLKVYNKYKNYTIPNLNKKIKLLEKAMELRYGKFNEILIDPMVKLQIFENLNERTKKNI